MAHEKFGNHDKEPVSPQLELAILHLWAAAMQIEQGFSRQEVESIRALSRAIDAIHSLPSAIGWDDVLPNYVLERL
jgi:hypothetical protein